MAQIDYKTMSDEDLQKVAKRRYYIKRGFFYHLSIFAVLSAVMLLIYFLTGRGYPWFAWPIGFWGLFVIGHTIGTKRSLNRIDGKPNAVDREAKRLRGK